MQLLNYYFGIIRNYFIGQQLKNSNELTKNKLKLAFNVYAMFAVISLLYFPVLITLKLILPATIAAIVFSINSLLIFSLKISSSLKKGVIVHSALHLVIASIQIYISQGYVNFVTTSWLAVSTIFIYFQLGRLAGLLTTLISLLIIFIYIWLNINNYQFPENPIQPIYFYSGVFVSLTLVFAFLYMMVERFTNYNNNLISKISESEKKLSLIIDNLPAAAIYIIDNKISFNKNFINLFGYSQKEIETLDVLIEQLFKTIDISNKENFIRSRNNSAIESPTLNIITKYSEIKTVEIKFQREVDYEIIIFKDVTNLKNKERQLEASNHFIENIAKALPYILYLFDLKTKKNIYANYAVETLLGYTITEIKKNYKSIYDLIHPEDLLSVKNFVAKITNATSDDIMEIEYRIQNKEGKYIWLRNISKVFKRDEYNVPSVVIGIAENINEKKIATIKYTNISERLQMATSEVNIGIWDWDINSNEFYWDETMYKLYESSRSVQPNPVKVFQNMVHPEDYDKAWIGLEEAYNRKERFETTYRIILPNKQIKFINTTFKVFKDEFGEPIRIMGVNQDVTDKKTQEIRLNINNGFLSAVNTSESLLFTEENFPLAMNTLLQQVANSIDVTHICISRYELHNNNTEELICKYEWHKEKLSEKDISGKETYLKKLITHQIASLKEGQIIRTNKKNNIHEPIINLELKPPVLSAPIFVLGKFWGILMLKDIKPNISLEIIDEHIIKKFASTLGGAIAQNQYKEALIIQMQNAEASSKAKTEFLSIISHEIRTPLNAITGLTNILLESEQSKPILDKLNLLKFSVDNLVYLMNDILDYNKIEAGKENINEVPTNLKELLLSIVESNNHLAERKQLQLVYELDKNLPNQVLCDRIKLTQILNNLLSNAIKYTEKGFVKFSATLMKISKNEIQLEFSVEDTGIGIEENLKEKIFDLYTTAKPSNDQTKRTGLGLAISSKLVKLLGGNISVDSKLNKGSKFYFTLPIKINHTENKFSNTEVSSAKKYNLSKRHILVVEDNEINSLITTKFLESWGANVIHANNGNEALQVLENNHVDIVLLDLFMPELDGYETAKKIRNLNDTKKAQTPIIAITASALKEVFDMAHNAGMNDYMTKPFKPNELFDKISKFL